jgi:hypothetical protein
MNIYLSNNDKVNHLGELKVFNGIVFPLDKYTDDILKLSGYTRPTDSQITKCLVSYINVRKFKEVIYNNYYDILYTENHISLLLTNFKVNPDFLERTRNILRTDENVSDKILSHYLNKYDYFFESEILKLLDMKPEECASVKNPYHAILYLSSKRKFIDTKILTDVVCKNAETSYTYSLIQKKPFLKGEEAIATNPTYSLLYAKRFNRRFFLGEPTMMKEPDIWKEYLDFFDIHDLFEQEIKNDI